MNPLYWTTKLCHLQVILQFIIKTLKKLENKNTSWYQKLFLIKVFWSIPVHVLVYKCAMVIVIPLLINWSPFLFFRFESLLTQNEGHGCFLYVWYVTLNLKTYHVCLVNQEFFFSKILCVLSNWLAQFYKAVKKIMYNQRRY